jgi:chromate transporter
MSPPVDVPPIASAPPPPSPDDALLGRQPPVPQPSIGELFLAFSNMALHGFGGVLPWARRAIVEEKRWMTPQEFNEAFAVGQFLPGANIVNFAVVYGGRLHGAAGAAVALAGLLIPPVAIVLTLAVLYSYWGDAEALQRVLAGVAAAAAGLIVATFVKMVQPLLRDGVSALLVVVAAFAAIGVLRLSLPLVLIVLAPASVALAAWARR